MAGKITIPGGGPNDKAVLQGLYLFPGVVGNLFYVSSVTGSSTGPGWAPENAYATLAQAVTAATASNGDVIILLPGHVETIAAAGLTISKAGLTIIGLGTGSVRPTYTWSATDSVLTISGANTTIHNIRTTVSIDEVVSMILVSAAGVTLDKVDFVDAGATQAIQWLLTTNAADQLTIQNCYHVQTSAAASAQKWIQLVGTNDTRILNNTFLMTANASTSSHLISGSTAVVNCEIGNNRGLFLGATITIIFNLVTTSTGIVYNNFFGSGTSVATAAAYTGDACFFFQNFWADTVQVSGLLAPVVDTDT